VFDSGGDGVKGGDTLTAQLYSRTGDTGKLLASVSFTAADPGTLDGDSRFKNLPAAIVLEPGSYCIAGYGFSDANPNGNTHGGMPQDWSTDDGGGLINFVGTSRYGTSGVGHFPSTPDGGPANRYAAGTFEFKAAVATPVGPPPDLLAVLTASTSEVVLSWPVSDASFSVYRAASLQSPVFWQLITNTPVRKNESFTLALPINPGQQQFFRLGNP
jgi:hypothetical protein